MEIVISHIPKTREIGQQSCRLSTELTAGDRRSLGPSHWITVPVTGITGSQVTGSISDIMSPEQRLEHIKLIL